MSEESPVTPIQLRRAERSYQRMIARYRLKRDDLIRQASSEGMRNSDIARALTKGRLDGSDFHRERVGQIIKERESK